tara:strand:+ start:725 stop:1132 length:408 start_codon:yes stop_codon:yes gene_type:complete
MIVKKVNPVYRIMGKHIVIMDFKKIITFIFILLLISSCSKNNDLEYQTKLENCVSALTTIILSHNHDVTALTPRSIKTLPPRNYYPEFPDPMMEADAYWNPGAKRTFKIIEENCPSEYYNDNVIQESKSFIDYGY